MNRNLLTYPENFSISLWTYDKQITGDTNNRIFAGGGSGAGVHGFNIAKDAGDGTVIALSFRTTDDALTTITGTITKEVWTHVVCIKNGTAISMYLNGVLVDSDTLPVATFKDVDGANTYLGGVATANSYNGLIDDVRIYDCPLSLKEIKELSLGKFAHYKFNGNAKDCSGSDLHGTAGADVSYNTLTPLIGSSSASFAGNANPANLIQLPFGCQSYSQNFSFSLWIKPDFDISTINYATILSERSLTGLIQFLFIGIKLGKWRVQFYDTVYETENVTRQDGSAVAVSYKKITNGLEWFIIPSAFILVLLNIAILVGLLWVLGEWDNYDAREFLDRLSTSKLLKTGLKKP